MLKCPACSNQLTPFTEQGTEVDICRGGCGGIWFDAQELERIEQTGRVSRELLFVEQNKRVAVDHSKTRMCPRCSSHGLDRVYHDADQEFELDACPMCGGLWLDLGELKHITDIERAAKAREKVLQDYSKSVAGGKGPRGARAVMELLFK